MRLDEIKRIPINDWAQPNAFLWLWATNSKDKNSKRPVLSMAFELLEHWGFTFHTMITWDKKTGPCPFSPYQIVTEHVLFGWCGKAQFKRDRLGKMKTVFQESSTRHSVKPASFYEHIRHSFVGPRLDVFGPPKNIKDLMVGEMSIKSNHATKKKTTPAQRANLLSGAEWLQHSFSVWRELDKNSEERQLKHPAMFTSKLVERILESYTCKSGVLLDPFAGSGTALLAALNNNMEAVGLDINPHYRKIFLFWQWAGYLSNPIRRTDIHAEMHPNKAKEIPRKIL